MSPEVIYRERCATSQTAYVQASLDGSGVGLLSSMENRKRYKAASLWTGARKFVRDVFLPQGYPDSVSEDYWEYQMWDSIQAFCSTLTGTLTTKAVLKGVGVGDATRTPLSATFTWLLKDGTGMIGRILFAWRKGTSLDADCKKWRLFADALNDTAMCLEMFFIPWLPNTILILSAVMKSIVGVAGGATKAAVSHHQAIRNNMGDVSAKDGSQETCLNLIGLLFSFLVLNVVAESDIEGAVVFVVCTVLHLYSNYRAVRSLKFKCLNKERMLILVRNYLTEGRRVYGCHKVNRMESVFLGMGLTDVDVCGFSIELGCSLNKLASCGAATKELVGVCATATSNQPLSSYLVLPSLSLRTILVALQDDADSVTVVCGFYQALILGRIAHERMGNKNDGLTVEQCVKLAVVETRDTFPAFLKGLIREGWETEKNYLPVGEWRAEWTSGCDKKCR